MKKLLTEEEHKRSIERLRYAKNKQLADKLESAKHITEHKLTPKIGWLRSLNDLIKSLDVWLRNHKKK